MSDVIHSDFLIHWTGKGIENDLGPGEGSWREIKESDRYQKAYLKRLKDILRYGLWLRKSQEYHMTVDSFTVNGKTFEPPPVPRICFTELKLSESENHAREYGRLGIGVKRPFLFARLGGPIHYLRNGRNHLFFPPYSQAVADEPELLCFFKRMTSPKRGPMATFSLYNESEWRIVFSEELKARMLAKGGDRGTEVVEQFVNPRNCTDPTTSDYYRGLPVDRRPEYLLPLDGWLSMIIYPDPRVKNVAFEDPEVRELIRKVKRNEILPRPPRYEIEMMPMEIDLPACRNV